MAENKIKSEDELQNILDRLAGVMNVTGIPEVAEKLGLAPNTIYSSKKKGSLPFDKIVKYLISHGYSIDEVIYGKNNPGLDHVVAANGRVFRYSYLDIEVGRLLDNSQITQVEVMAGRPARGDLHGHFLVRASENDLGFDTRSFGRDLSVHAVTTDLSLSDLATCDSDTVLLMLLHNSKHPVNPT